MLERLSRDKQSNLLGPCVEYKEKSFVYMPAGVAFTTLYFPLNLRMDPIS
jgi:hypothetical protein